MNTTEITKSILEGADVKQAFAGKLNELKSKDTAKKHQENNKKPNKKVIEARDFQDLDDLKDADYLTSNQIIRLYEKLESDYRMLADDDPDEAERIKSEMDELQDAYDFVENYGDALLVSENAWEEHCKDQAKAITGIQVNEWPLRAVNWKDVCADYRNKFDETEIDGKTYIITQDF
jgi:hypothetical protein